jgi:hypothetical protein
MTLPDGGAETFLRDDDAFEDVETKDLPEAFKRGLRPLCEGVGVQSGSCKQLIERHRRISEGVL